MIENCGNCQFLHSEIVLSGCHIYGCGHPSLKKSEQFVVPQRSTYDADTGERKATFSRVPMSCPRPDTEVKKRPAPDHDEQSP